MEVVHIMGMSCVGKRTLLEKLFTDPELRAQCGITGNVMGYFDEPQIGERHDPSKYRVVDRMLVDTEDHMLHKWQVARHPIIAKLKDDRPELTQRAIVLWRSIDDSIRRVGQSEKHVEQWPEYSQRAAMMHALRCIRNTVVDVMSLGIPTVHYDLTGLDQEVFRLGSPLPGILPEISAIPPALSSQR